MKLGGQLVRKEEGCGCQYVVYVFHGLYLTDGSSGTYSGQSLPRPTPGTPSLNKNYNFSAQKSLYTLGSIKF